MAHHHLQAMGGLFLVLLCFGSLLFLDVIEWLALMYFPDLAQRQIQGWQSYGGYAAWSLATVLTILWITLLGLALAGSTREVPLLRPIMRRRWAVRLSFIANSVALTSIVLVAALALHATSLTQTNRDGAAVYFLYDEGIPVPRWSYALGMYRVSLQAQENWGKGKAIVDRLNKETLRTALAHGKVVILATHGGDGYACTWYAPIKLGVFPPGGGVAHGMQSSRLLQTSVLGADNTWGNMESVAVNSDLRLVYIFGCDVGKKASQWEEHLAPARVITYNRWSTVFDHALWFGLTGPAKLKTMQ